MGLDIGRWLAGAVWNKKKVFILGDALRKNFIEHICCWNEIVFWSDLIAICRFAICLVAACIMKFSFDFVNCVSSGPLQFYTFGKYSWPEKKVRSTPNGRQSRGVKMGIAKIKWEREREYISTAKWLNKINNETIETFNGICWMLKFNGALFFPPFLESNSQNYRKSTHTTVNVDGLINALSLIHSFIRFRCNMHVMCSVHEIVLCA